MLRVSLSTSSFAELTPLKPRELTTQESAVSFATCSPGTNRSASGSVVAPERRMSSLETIATAAAAPARLSRLLETEVTWTSISSSTLSRLSAVVDEFSGCCWASRLLEPRVSKHAASMQRPSVRRSCLRSPRACPGSDTGFGLVPRMPPCYRGRPFPQCGNSSGGAHARAFSFWKPAAQAVVRPQSGDGPGLAQHLADLGNMSLLGCDLRAGVFLEHDVAAGDGCEEFAGF